MARKYYNNSPIAQLVEQMTVNHWVRGSSPRRGANYSPLYSGLFYANRHRQSRKSLILKPFPTYSIAL